MSALRRQYPRHEDGRKKAGSLRVECDASFVDVATGSFRRGVLTATPAREQTLLSSLQRVFTFLSLTEVRLSFPFTPCSGKNDSCHTLIFFLLSSSIVGVDQRSCSTSSPVSTGMGDCLRVGKLSHYVTSHPGQVSLAIPPWLGSVSTDDGYGHR